MGQQAFGKAVVEALLNRGDAVIAVFCAPDKEGRPADPIKDFAVQKGLPVYQPKSYKDADTLTQILDLKPDLCLMAYVTIFVPKEAREIPAKGSLCFHPSLLPRHRGPSSINWPIMWGETKSGLTVFYPDDGLDTGDILLQKEIDIGDEDTLGTVYFEKIFPLGVQAMLESVDLMKRGNPPRIVQDNAKATYESWCREADAKIDWAKPADDVFNLIRGTNPQPGAWTMHQGKKLGIFECAKIRAAGGSPGEVTDVTADGVTVAAKGGHILIKRVRPEGDKKITAIEHAAKGGIAKGTRLG
ncbi:MAG: methionyl-tRNA formyltransferase [Rhodospirillales bacterium]|nr:methionyl-tRNA formyltransferase [Rhodospirillales bacterium]